MNVAHMKVVYILYLYDFDRFTRRRIIRRNIHQLKDSKSEVEE